MAITRVLITFTALGLLSASHAMAATPGICEKAFDEVQEFVPPERIAKLKAAIQEAPATLEELAVRELKEISRTVSEDERAKIYSALIKDEGGLFGNILNILSTHPLEVNEWKYRNHKELSADFSLEVILERISVLDAAAKKTTGAGKVLAQRALLEYELWASKQILSAFTQNIKNLRLKEIKPVTLSNPKGDSFEVSDLPVESLSGQYETLFNWVGASKQRSDFAGLVIASALHELATSLREHSPKEVVATRAKRGVIDQRSKYNPLRFFDSTEEIQAEIMTAEDKIETLFSIDPLGTEFGSTPATTLSENPGEFPTVQQLVNGLAQSERDQVYSILVRQDGVFGEYVTAIRNPRNSRLRALLSQATTAQKVFDSAPENTRALYLQQLELAKWNAGTEMYRLLLEYLNPRSSSVYEFELKGYGTHRNLDIMRQAMNWIAKSPDRANLAKKIFAEVAPHYFGRLKDIPTESFDKKSEEIPAVRGIQQALEDTFFVKPHQIDHLNVGSLDTPSKRHGQAFRNRVAATSIDLKLSDRKRIHDLIITGPYGLGGELSSYLKSQPFSDLNLQNVITKEHDRHARTALGVWISAFYRKNSAQSSSGYVAVGENRFVFHSPFHEKDFDLPPFPTQNRQKVEAELAWLLQDENRMEYASISLTAFLAAAGSAKSASYYGVRMIDAMVLEAQGRSTLSPRLRPQALKAYNDFRNLMHVRLDRAANGELVEPLQHLSEMENDVQRRREAIGQREKPVPVTQSRHPGFKDLDVQIQSETETFTDYARIRMKSLKGGLDEGARNTIFRFLISHPSGFLGEFGIALSKAPRMVGTDGAFSLLEETKALKQISNQQAKTRARTAKQLLIGEQVLTILRDSISSSKPEFTTVVNTQEAGFRNRMALLKGRLDKNFLDEKELKAFRESIDYVFSKPEYVEFAQLLLADAALHFAQMPSPTVFAKPGALSRLSGFINHTKDIKALKAKMEYDYLVKQADPQLKSGSETADAIKYTSIPSLPPLHYEAETPQLNLDIAPLRRHLDDGSVLAPIEGTSLHYAERSSAVQLDILDIVLERYKTLETRLYDLRDLSASHFDSLVLPIKYRARNTARITTDGTMGGLRDHAKGVIDLKADASAMRQLITGLLTDLARSEKQLKAQAETDPQFKPVAERFSKTLATTITFVETADRRMRSLSDALSAGYRDVKGAVSSSSDQVDADNNRAAKTIYEAAQALRTAN